MEKIWNVRADGHLKESIATLQSSLQVSPLMAKLLAQRGLSSFEEAKAFFYPDIHALHDPFLMADMERAIARLREAIDGKERILVYGDYDVDGTTAVALVYSFLEDVGAEVEYYIPDRYTEGYGISLEGVDYAYGHGCRLVIALDCGIKSHEQMEHARGLGVDFIICDHHLPDETLPLACAVLDPKREDCAYPYKELSGCGVGFKLLQAYCIRSGLAFSALYKYLDLVAVSIASDIVSMCGENRILAHYGIEQLNLSPTLGLKALKDVAEVGHRPLRSEDVLFKLGPRINAAGRMEHGKRAVDLLVARNEGEAKAAAMRLNDFNKDRQLADQQSTAEALDYLSALPDNQLRYSTVVYDPSWKKGVVGIIASRLVEEFYRPTVVLTDSNGVVSGSARSVEGFDIHEALMSCSDLLMAYGGHRSAAGLTLAHDQVEPFKARFESWVREHLQPVQRRPVLDINAVVRFADLDDRFLKTLTRFEPFGPNNEAPLFMVEDVLPDRNARLMGFSKNHLRFRARQASTGREFQAVAFSQRAHFDTVREQKFRMCFSIEENYYYSPPVLQLNVRDIKPM